MAQSGKGQGLSEWRITKQASARCASPWQPEAAAVFLLGQPLQSIGRRRLRVHCGAARSPAIRPGSQRKPARTAAGCHPDDHRRAKNGQGDDADDRGGADGLGCRHHRLLPLDGLGQQQRSGTNGVLCPIGPALEEESRQLDLFLHAIGNREARGKLQRVNHQRQLGIIVRLNPGLMVGPDAVIVAGSRNSNTPRTVPRMLTSLPRYSIRLLVELHEGGWPAGRGIQRAGSVRVQDFQEVEEGVVLGPAENRVIPHGIQQFRIDTGEVLGSAGVTGRKLFRRRGKGSGHVPLSDETADAYRLAARSGWNAVGIIQGHEPVPIGRLAGFPHQEPDQPAQADHRQQAALLGASQIIWRGGSGAEAHRENLGTRGGAD